MATVTYIKERCQSVGAMRAVIAYCQREDKTVDPVTGQRFISGIHCDWLNAATEFVATKGAYHKLDGIHFYQYVQSFSPKENLTYQQAHQIALEFAEKAWPGYEVLVTTHGYTDFIFVNRDGGTFYQGSLNKTIRRIIRDCNDEVLMKEEENPVLLPHFSCHSLRHTFTTRMCEAGVNIKVMQDTLGHADISTTLNIYADVTKELKKSEFAGLDAYFETA